MNIGLMDGEIILYAAAAGFFHLISPT